jgi:uncharacterized membrane protein (Fun14 family)
MSAVLFGIRRGVSRFSLRVEHSAPKRPITSKTSAIVRNPSRITRRGIFIGCGAASLIFAFSDPLQCASGGAGSSGDSSDPSNIINNLLDRYSEQINQLGVSGVVGACAGLAMKRVSQEVAVTIGGIFALLQVLKHFGYITINYGKMQQDITKVC